MSFGCLFGYVWFIFLQNYHHDAMKRFWWDDGVSIMCCHDLESSWRWSSDLIGEPLGNHGESSLSTAPMRIDFQIFCEPRRIFWKELLQWCWKFAYRWKFKGKQARSQNLFWVLNSLFAMLFFDEVRVSLSKIHQIFAEMNHFRSCRVSGSLFMKASLGSCLPHKYGPLASP